MIYLRYLQALLTHKLNVFIAGLRVGVPVWRLVIHDWSKFLPVEFVPYARNFFGDYTSSPNDRDEVQADFLMAWNHHQKQNPHHWQYWVLIQDEDPTTCLPMPETYVREMVADWMGASKTYTGSWEMHDWLIENVPRYVGYMHPDTVDRLERVLKEQGYDHVWLLMEVEQAIRPPVGGVL